MPSAHDFVDADGISPQVGSKPIWAERAARSVIVRMPAKVNLHLGVYPGPDARGYHRVCSVMVAVGLFDEVAVCASPSLEIACQPPVNITASRTTTCRAIVELGSELGIQPHVAACVTRAIPGESGLGSASVDAAAALRACCALWGVDPQDDTVRNVARRVGADVAFFLNPAPSLLEGVGDDLSATYPPIEVPIVLVRPDVGVGTAAAYATFDRAPTTPVKPGRLCAALAAGDVGGVADNLFNNLANAAMTIAPAIGDVRSWLRCQEGVLAAEVTGSGSCVFALCESDDAARALAKAAALAGLWSHATRTVGADSVALTG